MKHYIKNNKYVGGLPFRIRLSDGSTRTNPYTFTEEMIADAGYVEIPGPPDDGKLYGWSNGQWVEQLAEQEE